MSLISDNFQDGHMLEGKTLAYSCDTAATPVSVSSTGHPSSRTTMGSTPKRWVMKPLTPKLEKADLRPMLSPGSKTYSLDQRSSPSQDQDSSVFKFDAISVSHIQSVTVSAMNGEDPVDVVVRATQVVVSEESSITEDWQNSDPSSPGSPGSTDSHVGFYSFVEDPSSPEAEKNEAYMLSPERQAKLSTLKEKNSFKLQTYAEDRRPEKLFEDTNGDSLYQLEDNLAESNGEDRPDRMEIIRNQAPRKNLVLKEQWSALENLDLSNSPNRLVEGFSLCYRPASPKLAQSEAEPGSVDSQQIDFNSARKQFLMMELSKEDPFQKGPQQMVSSPKPWGRSLGTELNLSAKNVRELNDEPNQNSDSSKRQEEEIVTFREDSKDQVQSGPGDNLVTGLHSQNLGNKRNENLSSEPSTLEITTSLPVACTNETPIEREIRIAQEREEDLRRSRGILRSDTSEMVEIKTKPIISQPLPQIKAVKAKETSRVSFLIQRELERVNQSQGCYDRGTPYDLDESRRASASESHQETAVSLKTSPAGTPVLADDVWSAERSVLVDQTDVTDSKETLSPCCPHRHEDETKIWRGSSNAAELLDARTTDSHYATDVSISSPPFWLASYKEKEPMRTPPPEGVIRSRAKSAWSRLESTNERRSVVNTPDLIRREIEEDLRREQELQELRGSSSQALLADGGAVISEPSVPSPIPSERDSGQNDNDRSLAKALITPLNTSQKNVTETVTHLPDRQRMADSPFIPLNVDSTPVSHTSLAGSRFPSIMTAQPWSSPRSGAAVWRGIPALPAGRSGGSSALFHKGLTETLLEDFEERQMRLKLEESAYAGIQPIDSINNAVVDATRVARHKSPQALRWEAGEYANKDE